MVFFRRTVRLLAFALVLAAFQLALRFPFRRPPSARVLAATHATALLASEDIAPLSAGMIRIAYPEDSSIFPPGISSPTFLWRDSSPSVAWRIAIDFADGAKPFAFDSQGEPLKIGEIDPRCVSSTNQPPTLTPEQSAAHTWKPDPGTWALIQHHSSRGPATVTVRGLDAGGHPLLTASVHLSTSRDPVGALIFYRDVPLMPAMGRQNIIQPLAPSSLYLINWRVRDVSQPESRIVMHGLHTCANCHSFSLDGKTMGMDVDGPANDKGLYAVVPVGRRMTIASQDTIDWNPDLRIGESRVGFMSQISPDGRYVLSTLAGRDQDIPSSYFVTNFTDYGFLQVFYPTRGILAYYDRNSGRRQPLPGADDPRYVQTGGTWSPDGKFIVFERAEARDSNPPGNKLPLQANDPNEVQIQYSLYRIPFNNGRGGTPEPITGASSNGMSNSFPRISPDGRWIIFVESRNGQLMRPDSQLYIVPVTGGRARRMRCNTRLMNSWHSFSPNGRWLVFSSKSRSPYTGMFLTHIDENGNDSPAIYIENSTAANRAVNIPEFVKTEGIDQIDTPAADLYRVIDEAMDLQGKGNYPEAIARWRQALAIDPNDARSNNGMGMAQGFSGQVDEAILYFRRAAQIDSNFFEASYNLAILFSHLNRTSEAVDAWRTTVRIRPRFAQGHEQLARALYKQGAWEEALLHLRRALEVEPNRLSALNFEATLLATCLDDSVRDGREALRLARQADRLSNGNDPLVLDILSAALAETGDFPAALETEQKALTLAGSDVDLSATLSAHLARYKAYLPLRQPALPATR